jgi:riboflavin transporter FmnP
VINKRETYKHKLASYVVIFSSVIVLLLFFVEIPKENQRIVDMVLGVIVGSGLVSVINYFFGATESKEEK